MLVGNPCVRPDECYASGSSKYSEYHYEFLYKRGYFTKKSFNDYRSACLLNSDTYECFVQRGKLDGYFNATNSSMYNIYDKCYKSKTTDVGYINSGCEDNAGIMTWLNDPIVRANWNIVNDKEWNPCNSTVFGEYLGKNNSEWLYPILIKNKLKIVIILLFSGSILEILTRIFQSSVRRDGWMSFVTLLICLLSVFGGNGGFQEFTKEKIRLEASSGNSEILLW
jgi:hypothetical protein